MNEESVQPVRQKFAAILNKWFDNNVVVQAFRKSGPFYEGLVNAFTENGLTSSADHQYAGNHNRFEEYLQVFNNQEPLKQKIMKLCQTFLHLI